MGSKEQSIKYQSKFGFSVASRGRDRRRAVESLRRAEGLTAHCIFYFCNVNFLHCHHCFKCTLCYFSTPGHCISQNTGSDLPRKSPFVFAPATPTRCASVVNNRIPITVGFGLLISCNLKGKRLAMFKHIAAVKSYTRYSTDE